MPGNIRKVRGEAVAEKGERLDSAEAPVTVDADKAMVHVSKSLFTSTEYQAVRRYDGQTRDWLMRRALPSYFREGFYLLPLAILDEVDRDLEARRQTRQRLIDAFLDTYDAKVLEARSRLRELFSEADYPSRTAIAGSFRWEVRYLTFNVPQTLEGVSQAVFEREKAKAEQLWQRATEDIHQALRDGMAALVTRMVERLTPGPDGKPLQFRESLVTAMDEFLRYFKARNLSDDQELNALVEKAQQVMKGVDITALRKNADVRETVRDGFARIQTLMDSMAMTRPPRGIRFDDEE
jgi:hypothetical protein